MPRRRWVRFGRRLGAGLAVLVAPAAPAQTTAAPPSSTAPAGDIVVRRRTDDAIARSVAARTATWRSAQVSRWNDAICTRVFGPDAEHAAFIADRIDAEAKSLGIPIVGGRCAPSILVLLTDDADAMAAKLLADNPGLFGNPMYGIAHGAVLAELKAPRAVRWIDASRASDADGLDSGYHYGGGSRIARPTRENAVLSYVIVDARRMAHISWGQLADYLTVVTLARPTLAAGSHDPESILSIFTARDEGRSGPAALTETDRAFLRALYASNPSLEIDAQRAQIADAMRRNAAAGAAAARGDRPR